MGSNHEMSTTRRDFGKALAAFAATSGAAAAQEKKDEPPKPAESSASIPDALLEAVRLKYGKNLTAEQLQNIKRSLTRQQFLANRLKQFKLTNGDEPAFVFSASVHELINP